MKIKLDNMCIALSKGSDTAYPKTVIVIASSYSNIYYHYYTYIAHLNINLSKYPDTVPFI